MLFVVLLSDGGCGAVWDTGSRAASGHGAGIEGELATRGPFYGRIWQRVVLLSGGVQEIGLRPAICEEVDTAQKRRERGIAQDAWARWSGYTLNRTGTNIV
jgi:hypothetical protein